jgi:predicted ATP-grasp superfamily ATP-dependent carboligase
MRLGAFELAGSVPELKEPHALAILQPWIDVGNVGTLTLSRLESYFETAELAKLAMPGYFLDFTRYRPTIFLKEGRRELHVPNVTISYARQEKGRDFLFLHLMEPHFLAEVYIDSILRILKRFDVKRYCLLGAMYDMVPYTRPLLVTGAASDPLLQNQLTAAKVVSSDYQGPTTIAMLIPQQALLLGIETLSLIVHLPGYLGMNDDYRGEVRLMEVLGSLYDFAIAPEDIEKAKGQEEQVRQIAERMLAEESGLRLILNQLEANYDSRIREGKKETKLSPEIERFLQNLGRRFSQG